MEHELGCKLSRILLLATLFTLVSGIVWAQGGTGELTGLVTDPSGAVVPSVQVYLTNSATGDKRGTQTTAAGIYRFVALPVVGTYSLELSPKGFRNVRIADIVISVGSTVNQDVRLEVGAATEQVTVEAGGQLVQTSEAQISDLVDRRVWQQMPLETRSQNEFIALLAGAVPASVAQLNVDRGAAVSGARSGTGNFLVEGFDNNDQEGGGSGMGVGPGGANTTISPDAIQEYRVIEHGFSAEYGKAGGFVTDTVLKSGTNQWHGSLFEYNRVQALAANHFFSNRNHVKDALVRNQFGGSFGGPIKKDKTFFYGSIEYHRQRSASPVSETSTTPDFVNFVNSGAFETFMESSPNGLCNNQVFLDNFLGNASFQSGGIASPCPGAFAKNATLGPIFNIIRTTEPFVLCVPGAVNCSGLTGNGGSIVTGTTVVQCTVPGCVQSGTPGTVAVVYPVPVYGQATLTDAFRLDQTRYTVKFDHKLGGKDQLNAAYLYDNADTLDKNPFFVSEPIHGRAQNAGATWTHTFSATILNQARISYVRHTSDNPSDPSLGATGVPYIFTLIDPLVVAFGSPQPTLFTENEFQYKDDLSLTKGEHNFKMGAEYRRTRNGSYFEPELNGEFAPWGVEDLMTDATFGDLVDQLLFGGPVLGGFGFAETSVDPTTGNRPDYYRGYRANEVAWYAQDDWRVTRRLTLNLGLRWEYFGPPHNFKPGIDSNVYFGPPTTPTATTSDNPFFPANSPFFARVATASFQVRNHEIWKKDLNNFAPRIGFAWDLLGNQKLAVRGGYGIAYDRMYNNIFENIRFNPPFFCFCNTGVGGGGAPGGGLSTPGLYTVPFTSTSQFINPSIFPNGMLPQPSPRHVNQDLENAYYQHLNFGLQYKLAKDFVVEINYVGTMGRKLIGLININTFPGRVACPSFNTPAACAAAGFPSGFSGSRPNTNMADDNFRANAFTSNYHALQVTVRKNFSDGLQFNSNYTFSKALDELSDVLATRGSFSGGFEPEDSTNIRLDYGRADFDTRHRFVTSVTYDLPFLKSNRWLGGWSLSSIVSLQTGVPFSIFDSLVDTNKNGQLTDRASYIGTGSITNGITHAQSPADGYLDLTKFAATTCPLTVNLGLWCEGGSGRNVLSGPGYVNVDFGVAKSFKIKENSAFQFQVNFFNLFNRANFGLPQYDLAAGVAFFGKSTTTLDPRITQLALRFDF